LKTKEGLSNIAQKLEKQNIFRRFNTLQPSEEIQLVIVESDRQENNCATSTSIISSEDDDFEIELDQQVVPERSTDKNGTAPKPCTKDSLQRLELQLMGPIVKTAIFLILKKIQK
jgi:hypothetical protein